MLLQEAQTSPGGQHKQVPAFRSEFVGVLTTKEYFNVAFLLHADLELSLQNHTVISKALSKQRGSNQREAPL